MNDKILQLAFAVYHNPGVYALLLGSGVSRSAEILTGELIIHDLIYKIAGAVGEEISGNPIEWYTAHFKTAPGYDTLLEALGQTRLDRNALLRDYFEPTDEDLTHGRKVPTKAHKAIAWLIKEGYIKVVLTTNFDRLLETALAQEGVVPDTVITEDTLNHAPPLQHSRITIIKLHGDYLGRTRNIGKELEEYPEAINKLLDRILDEYGLVVCGWSAQWDEALKQAVKRIQQDRYGAYWIAYSQPLEAAKELIDLRDAQLIVNISADEFFVQLKDKIEALTNLANRQRPLTVPVTIEKIKKLILENNRIALDDFFQSVTRQTFKASTSDDILQRRQVFLSDDASADENIPLLYFEETKLLIHSLTAASWYGNSNEVNYVTQAINQWTQNPFMLLQKNGNWIFLIPMFLFYASGIVAVYRNNWNYLYIILTSPTIYHDSYRKLQLPFLDKLKHSILEYLHYPWLSPYLERILKSVFENYPLTDTEYINAFDLFETITALIFLDVTVDNKDWFPPHFAQQKNRSQIFLEEFWFKLGKQGQNCGLLKTGLFKNSPTVLEETLKNYQQIQLGFQNSRRFPDYAAIYRKGLESIT